MMMYVKLKFQHETPHLKKKVLKSVHDNPNQEYLNLLDNALSLRNYQIISI